MSSNNILMSIHPKWCAKYYAGEKLGELRKGWFEGFEGKKFYIYCTSIKPMNITDYYEAYKATEGLIDRWVGKVIGECVCDRIDRFTAEFVDEKKHGVRYEDIRKVWVDENGEENYCIVTSNDNSNPNDCDLCRDTCLSFKDIKKYIGENFHEKKFSFLHFTNLIFYDTPKDLSDFGTTDMAAVRKCERRNQTYHKYTDTGYIKNGFYCEESGNWCTCCKTKPIKRPPQSYCYVEGINTKFRSDTL